MAWERHKKNHRNADWGEVDDEETIQIQNDDRRIEMKEHAKRAHDQAIDYSAVFRQKMKTKKEVKEEDA